MAIKLAGEGVIYISNSMPWGISVMIGGCGRMEIQVHTQVNGVCVCVRVGIWRGDEVTRRILMEGHLTRRLLS